MSNLFWCLHPDCLDSLDYFLSQNELDIHKTIHIDESDNEADIQIHIDESDNEADIQIHIDESDNEADIQIHIDESDNEAEENNELNEVQFDEIICGKTMLDI